MALPVANLVKPAALQGQTNGRIDDNLLVNVPGLAGGPTVRLLEPAARAWRALTAAARAAGHTLKASGPHDSFRPYATQERIFRERYQTTPIPGRPSRVWNGQRWWQKPGTAAAAVPGTSNHGWALAVDTGEERDDDSGTESMDSATLAWLVDNEATYGFSHELQSEPWHIRYVAGDNIPTAVLAFEASSPQEDLDMTPAVVLDSKGNPWFFRVDPASKACEAYTKSEGKWFPLGGEFSSGVDATQTSDKGILIVGQGKDGKTTFGRVIYPGDEPPTPDTEWFKVA